MNKNQKIFKLDYNLNYNISNNKKHRITYHQHLLDKTVSRQLSLEKIEETIKTENVYKKKTKFPKICYTRYYGKENITYFVIVLKHKNFMEVRTAWKKKGK